MRPPGTRRYSFGLTEQERERDSTEFNLILVFMQSQTYVIYAFFMPVETYFNDNCRADSSCI